MLFQTWNFVIFFSVVMAGLGLLRPGLRPLWLLTASWYFYGSFNPVFLIFLVYLSVADYFIGLGLGKAEKIWLRKLLLTVSVMNGVALLSLFKYANFIVLNLQALLDWFALKFQFSPITVPTLAQSANTILAAVGLNFRLAAAMLVPVGLSYFTFKSLSYTIDVYRRNLRAETNLIHYGCYLAFFPTVMMGPIDRAGLFLRQLRHRIAIRPVDISDGISLFISGLFKKVVLADTLAVFVNRVYDAPSGSYDALSLLLATFGFAWQLYGDFSGYSDMASGIARIMGFRITLNFNNPYVAVSFTDFWRRWHIGLSTWFRDYVYIPLGGNQVGIFRLWFNLFITMVVSGFWHGETWNFLVWGAWHGVLSVIWRHIDNTGWYRWIPKIVQQLVVFGFASFGWIFFRSESLSQAWSIIGDLFSWSAGVRLIPWYMFTAVAAVWMYELLFASRFRKYLELAPVRWALMASVIVLILLVPSSANQKFIYFQF